MDLSIQHTDFELFCRELADAVSHGYALRRTDAYERWFRPTVYTAWLEAPAGVDLIIGPFEAR